MKEKKQQQQMMKKKQKQMMKKEQKQLMMKKKQKQMMKKEQMMEKKKKQKQMKKKVEMEKKEKHGCSLRVLVCSTDGKQTDNRETRVHCMYVSLLLSAGCLGSEIQNPCFQSLLQDCILAPISYSHISCTTATITLLTCLSRTKLECHFDQPVWE